MHKIKIGEFKYLVVAMFNNEEGNYTCAFCDSDQEAARWIEEVYQKHDPKTSQVSVYKELNYLLDAMVKNKDNAKGTNLYLIYTKHYAEDEQMTKVIEFWNNKEKQRQKKSE